MKGFFIILSTSILLILIALSCEIDHGLYPIDYQIKGNIVFFKGEPPANTDRIEVFALKEFPPEDPQNFLYLGQSGALNYSKGDTIPYSISVSPTSYELIGVLWREKGKDWALTGIMGIYTGDAFSLLPQPVEVSKEHPVAENVNFYANWETVSKSASVGGTIHYEGEWPSDTQLLLLAVYRTKPTSDFGYIAFENVDYAQPIRVDSSSYRLAVNAGTYNYIVLFWVGNSISKLSDLVELGVYKNPQSSDQPGTIRVADGESRDDVDIFVDFNTINFK